MSVIPMPYIPQQVNWVPWGGMLIPPSRPFTSDEIEVLRELAREMIADAEQEDEQDELEYLAEKYGYELTPKPADDDTPF